MESSIKNIIDSQASKHSLFSTPMDYHKEGIMSGFVLEGLLQKKFLDEKSLIDMCLQIAFGYNSIINAIKLSTPINIEIEGEEGEIPKKSESNASGFYI